jgi:hypothetical protein
MSLDLICFATNMFLKTEFKYDCVCSGIGGSSSVGQGSTLERKQYKVPKIPPVVAMVELGA